MVGLHSRCSGGLEEGKSVTYTKVVYSTLSFLERSETLVLHFYADGWNETFLEATIVVPIPDMHAIDVRQEKAEL